MGKRKNKIDRNWGAWFKKKKKIRLINEEYVEEERKKNQKPPSVVKAITHQLPQVEQCSAISKAKDCKPP